LFLEKSRGEQKIGDLQEPAAQIVRSKERKKEKLTKVTEKQKPSGREVARNSGGTKRDIKLRKSSGSHQEGPASTGLMNLG